ncbi:O-antigen ligase [Sphingomonas sp. TZW2008]|uniref:O-antigen ligase family protein n=1 Tax=Sphingomonas sp. TZW2008 TaxID=1917973 RepID=UPI0015C5033C|nr:O-antigen ligase family protein [Sphingomonas sp. TZW2008]
MALWIGASILWSADPAISTRRAIAYAGSLMIIVTLAFATPPREVIRALVWITIGILIVTAILFFVDPTYAVHQAGQIGVAEHAGRLRGTFSHKNEFARMVAAGFAVLLLFGRAVLPFRKLWFAMLALGVALLLLAGSAKIVIAFPVALVAVWLVRVPIAPPYRFLVLVLLGGPLMLVYASGMLDAAIEAVFGSLGRTAGMSGRDEIWAAAWHSIARHPVFGQGYYAGWANEAQAEILGRKYISLGHAHNGFLETLLDLGAIGLALALIPLIYLALRAVAVPPGQVERLQGLAAMWIVLDLTLNFAGSYLINYNDLYPTMTLLLCLWFVRLDRGTIDERSLALLSAPPARVKRRPRLAPGPLPASEPGVAHPSADV